MGSRLVSVTADALRPHMRADFWGELLGREVVTQPEGLLLPGDDTQVGLRFAASSEPEVGPDRLHLHVTTSDDDDLGRTVEQVLALGGRHVDVGQRPEEDHVVLADAGGVPFCVIGPGNGFLAGCGRLGEVTCDGSRAVGLFWRDALGWPLVWDRDEETAVQSPRGGTKVSWGGPPVAPRQGRNRQRLELAADDVAVEVARLVALGAVRLTEREEVVELADPDGNEFSLMQA